MQPTDYYTNMTDVTTKIHEILKNSDGYPHDYNIDMIAAQTATWDKEHQAFTITNDEEKFWNIVWNNMTETAA